MGSWTSFCFCHRPLRPIKVETAYRGAGYGLYEWLSVCYACGQPPESCTCFANGTTPRDWYPFLPFMQSTPRKIVMQTKLARFDAGFPLCENEEPEEELFPP